VSFDEVEGAAGCVHLDRSAYFLAGFLSPKTEYIMTKCAKPQTLSNK
jgi:hypothetical protein